MRTGLFVLVAAASLCLVSPNELLAQQMSKEHVVTFAPATEAFAIAPANAPSRRVVAGAVIGGLVGGTITAGCLLLYGMGAPVVLPYCLVPAVLGAAFGAWVGAMADERIEEASGP